MNKNGLYKKINKVEIAKKWPLRKHKQGRRQGGNNKNKVEIINNDYIKG